MADDDSEGDENLSEHLPLIHTGPKSYDADSDDGFGPESVPSGPSAEELPPWKRPLSRAAMAQLDTSYRFDDGYAADMDEEPDNQHDGFRFPSQQDGLSCLKMKYEASANYSLIGDDAKPGNRFSLTKAVDSYILTDYERALEKAWFQISKRSDLRPIWETSAFLAPIMGGKPKSVLDTAMALTRMDRLSTASCPEPAYDETVQQLEELKYKPEFGRIVAKMRGLTWKDSDEADRQKGLLRWTRILCQFAESFKVGRLILKDLSVSARSSNAETVSDILVKKGTRTLLARSGSVLKFMEHCGRLDLLPFPLDEGTAYSYVSYLKETCAAPTKASGFHQAIGFMMGTFVPDGAKEVYESPRIRGSVDSQLIKKKKTKRRRGYKADELAWLEYLACSSPDPLDKVFAGFELFRTYARARLSDTRSCRRIVKDFSITGGYVQVDVDDTKTGRSIEKRRQFLPCVAPRQGVRKTFWADSWLEAREKVGLPVESLDDHHRFPLMPMPMLNGRWTERSISSSECRKWASELLLLEDGKADVKDLGSHSAKVTTLNWMAVLGATAQVRKALGYHIDQADVTMSVYSRDMIAEPLRQLERCLAAVRLGVFLPDKSRSGALRGSLKAVGFSSWYPGLQIDEDELEFQVQSKLLLGEDAETIAQNGSFAEKEAETSVDIVPDSSDSSSSDESSSADVSTARVEMKASALRGCSTPESNSSLIFFHDVFTTIHRLRAEGSAWFSCGRALRAGFTKLDSVQESWPKCKVCFPP